MVRSYNKITRDPWCESTSTGLKNEWPNWKTGYLGLCALEHPVTIDIGRNAVTAVRSGPNPILPPVTAKEGRAVKGDVPWSARLHAKSGTLSKRTPTKLMPLLSDVNPGKNRVIAQDAENAFDYDCKACRLHGLMADGQAASMTDLARQVAASVEAEIGVPIAFSPVLAFVVRPADTFAVLLSLVAALVAAGMDRVAFIDAAVAAIFPAKVGLSTYETS